MTTPTGAIVIKNRDKRRRNERAGFAMSVGCDMTPGAWMILRMELDLVRCNRDLRVRACLHPSRFTRDRFTWLPHRGAGRQDLD